MVVSLIWWLRPEPQPAEVDAESIREQEGNPRDNSAEFPSPTNSATGDDSAVAREKIFLESADPEYARRRFEQSKVDPQFDWKQPINFYGRVLDDDAQPVANAAVSFSWNSLSESGTSRATTESDEQGLFSLNGASGKRLYVEVSKTGYYVSGTNRIAFEYANPFDGLFRPDPNRPVLFHLRKKGEGIDLITSQYGVVPHFAVPMPLDVAAIRVDLLEREVVASGFLELSQNKPPYAEWKQADSWSFRMEIREGGFVEHSEEFPFEAPEEGYQPILEFHFEKNAGRWATRISRDYYFKFGSPAKYGRLQLRTSIMDQGARLTYAINPTGSRNLEPKSNE